MKYCFEKMYHIVIFLPYDLIVLAQMGHPSPEEKCRNINFLHIWSPYNETVNGQKYIIPLQ
jgi:hypothetical protein